MRRRLIALGVAAVCLCCTGCRTVSTPTGTQSTIRIDSGGSAYTDSKGQVWSADSSFAGGQQGSTSAAVANTADPKIYQTEHYGSFDYNFALVNGTYSVTLKFAEIYFTTTGRRVFNVAINGQTVLSNFDIVAQAGGAFKAIDKTFSVNVTNSTLNIHMIPLTENPTISGIEITPPVLTFTPVRVNAGGGSYTDPAGQVWSADKGFSGGATGTTTASISKTSVPILYQSERYGAVSYQFAAPNGNYNVTLKFAENRFQPRRKAGL
jgi:hypothetical protein